MGDGDGDVAALPQSVCWTITSRSTANAVLTTSALLRGS
jgi:hypothetical protein